MFNNQIFDFNHHVVSSEGLDEMIDYVAIYSNLSRETCKILVPLTFQVLRNFLLKSQKIKIEDFGTFVLLKRKKYYLKFRLARSLKRLLNAV